jgi:hypothetical protein
VNNNNNNNDDDDDDDDCGGGEQFEPQRVGDCSTGGMTYLGLDLGNLTGWKFVLVQWHFGMLQVTQESQLYACKQVDSSNRDG